MFLIYLFNFLKGYVIIKAEGYFLERFLNICAHRQILLADIKHKGAACLTAVVTRKGFRQLRGPAYKTKTRVRILRKRGLPFWMSRLFKRKALMLGFVLFALIMFFLTTHVWVIDIQGNSSVKTMDITRQLENCGLKRGVPIWSINPDRLQISALARMPELSWLWVTVEGTRVVVDVKERILKPSMVPQDMSCNIIALKNGIITRLIVKNGVSMVKENMAVAQGQLLVNGIIESKTIPARWVRAEAEIWAKTTHYLKNDFSLTGTKRVATGNNIVRNSIEIMGKEYNLFLGVPCTYDKYDSILTQKQLKVLKNIYLPIVFKKAEYRQINELLEKVSQDEAVAQGKLVLEDMLKREASGGKIDDMQFETVNVDENTISISLTAHCTEQIAEQVPISR